MSNTILYKNKNPAPEYCYILRDGTSYAARKASRIVLRGTTRIENGSMQKPKLHS